MIKNFFIAAIRNSWKQPLFSLINVAGLSVGISASLIIFMMVAYEFGFDRFEPDRHRIYQTVLTMKYPNFEGNSSGVPAPLGLTVQGSVSGLEQVVPVFQFPGDASANVTLENQGSKPTVFKKQDRVVFTNQDYFKLLGLQWVAGKGGAAFKEPFRVVLTAGRASVYFPGIAYADMIGKSIRYNDITVTVAGIVGDIREQTDLKALEFISLPSIAASSLKEDFGLDVWDDWMAYSKLYLKLAPGADPQGVTAQLNRLLGSHQKKESGRTLRLQLLPLADKHFDSRFQDADSRLADKTTLYSLIGVAVFLLSLACINFINLSTAQASRRAKEVGVRKTMGGSRTQLVFQFLGETFLLTLIAVLLSVCLTPVLLKAFAGFIPPGLTIAFLSEPLVILYLLLLTLIVCVFSGLYPAFVLSGYKPVLVLKNRIVGSSGQSRHALVRKGLTVSQFMVAQFFLILTLLVSKQIHFATNADMGFRKDAVLYFRTPNDTVDRHRVQLLQGLYELAGVSMVSNGYLPPAAEGGSFPNLSFDNGKEMLRPQTQVRWGDTAYFELYGLQLLAGRRATESDSVTELVVNNSFAHAIGFQHPRDALGQIVTYNGMPVPIVGVMKDFHEHSFHIGMNPMVFVNGSGNMFHIRLAGTPDSWGQTIGHMGKLFRSVYPDENFNYQFVDDMVARFYEKDQRTASLLSWATGLSIFISLLGLLGLTIFSVNSRAKEVSIRKVLGATAVQLWAMLSADFIRLILLAMLIALPLAWWAGYRWLQDFEYKTSMSWWIFVLSGAAMLLVAGLALSFQTLRAARANPVDSLRDE